MGKTLHDPELPPGAIVKGYGDGRAVRNDGVELKPASKNPWYVLATVEGEQSDSAIMAIENDLHIRNRRIWNGWMCQDMAEEDRKALADKLKLNSSDLALLSATEIKKIIARFADAFPGKNVQDCLPEPGALIDMSGVHFPNGLVLRNCFFAEGADFNAAHFDELADFTNSDFDGYANFRSASFAGSSHFSDAYFDGYADFNTVHFVGHSDFSMAHFSRYAEFIDTNFAGIANFRSTIFEAAADFRTARFAGLVSFEKAHFAKIAEFERAEFAGPAAFNAGLFAGSAIFSDGAFKAATNFSAVAFLSSVPEFYQCDMHQDTRFSTNKINWPSVSERNAEAGKQAYTRLRQIANDLHNPDDEHFFLRQEMRCKEVLADPFHAWMFRLFRWASDYGYSVARPAAAMVVIWAIGAAAFAGCMASPASSGLPADVTDSPFRAGMSLSFANLFGFLGINRLYFLEVLRGFPDVLQFVAGAQTVLGVILLFFLGLGLRNRFRLH